MTKKLIAYVGVFPFPFGQAASKRVLGNLMLLQDLGYNVIVGHGGGAKEGVYNNINHYGLNELFSDSRGLVRLFNIIFRGGNNTVEWLSELEIKPEYVVVYGGYYHFSKRILKYCQTNNIKVIFDVVEWYEPSQMIGGKYGLFYNSFLMAFKYVYPKADGIFAISTNLKKVFDKSDVVIIPPLVSNEITRPYCCDNKNLSLIYAGNIGNKDSLYEIIQVVEKLFPENKIRLDIFGPSEEEIRVKYNIKEFSPCVQVHGKIKQEEINSFIMKADFTIFTRPDTHCNKYGFPSKFVESLSLGVPVATNLTSDIGQYLKDEYNGFVIDGNTKQAIEITIRKMLGLSSVQKMAMKENALRTAEENFSSKSTHLRKNVSEFFTRIDEESSI